MVRLVDDFLMFSQITCRHLEIAILIKTMGALFFAKKLKGSCSFLYVSQMKFVIFLGICLFLYISTCCCFKEANFMTITCILQVPLHLCVITIQGTGPKWSEFIFMPL